MSAATDKAHADLIRSIHRLRAEGWTLAQIIHAATGALRAEEQQTERPS